MKIGAMELIVIFIVALLVIGPDKLPAYARKFGNALREFRKASADITEDIRESVVDPLEEAQRPLREAMEPLEDLNRDVRENIKGVERDLKNIGKENLGKKTPATDEQTIPAKADPPEAEEPAAGAAEGAGVNPEKAPADPAVTARKTNTAHTEETETGGTA